MDRERRQRGGDPGATPLAAGVLLVLALVPWTRDGPPETAVRHVAPPTPVACTAAADTISGTTTGPPEFYAIELIPTGRVTGTANYEGSAEIRFADSPFDVAVSSDGAFRRQVHVDLGGLRPAPRGDYVVWVTSPDLDRIEKLGPLGDDMTLTGEVALPKFLLVISLEDEPGAVEGKWSGPIVLRGMSRSGFMHTMAGHGPFQSEPCSSYGFSR